MKLPIHHSLQALAQQVLEASGHGKRPCAVVLDPAIASILTLVNEEEDKDLLLKSGATKEYSIGSNVTLDWREDGPVLFILRPNPLTCRTVSQQIRQQLSKSARTTRQDFRIVFVPRRSFRCEEVFREEHVMDHITSLRAVHMGFIPVEEDVWSMEHHDFLHQCKIVGDTSPLAFVARALMDFGPINHVRSKGYSSKEVLDLYLRMKRESKQQKQQQSKDDDGSCSSGSSDDEEAGEDKGVATLETISPLLQPGGPLDLWGGSGTPTAKFPAIDTLILLDRELDMISPLSTPLTYEAQLDECFGLKAGFLKLHSSILRLDDEEEEEEQARVNGEVQVYLQNDDLFQEIRNVAVTEVMRILNENAKQLKDTQDQVHRTRDVEDLQEFVRRIPELQNRKRKLSLHIALGRRIAATCTQRKFRTQWHAEREAVETGDARLLLERAQDLAARGEPLARVLRLLCLNCVLVGGFPQSTLDQIRQDLIHAYGFETMFTLDNLDRMGLLTQRPFHPQHKFSAAAQAAAAQASAQEYGRTRCVFPNLAAVRTNFKLICSDPTAADASYVFAGMAPLSVRLVQMAISPGWDTKTDMLKMVGDGPTICRLASSDNNNNNNAPAAAGKGKKTMLVMYLGGVCLAEIAALRLVSSQPDCPYNIMIGTTSVINGTTMVRSFFHASTQ